MGNKPHKKTPTNVQHIDKRAYLEIGKLSLSRGSTCTPLKDDYYQGNTADFEFDRGHLLPNKITNYDDDWQRTTMSLTNAAAQVKFEDFSKVFGKFLENFRKFFDKNFFLYDF